MKFSLVFLIGLVLAVSAAPTQNELMLQQELAKGFTSFLSNFLQQVVLPPVVTAVQDSAGLLAQLTAGISEGGLDAILVLLGKRDIAIPKGAWDDLLSSLQNGATNLANQLTSQLGLTLTQVLLQISQGKRNVDDYKGTWDDLLSSLQNGPQIWTSQLGLFLTPEIFITLISQGKINADDFKGAWDDLLSSLQNGATNLANQLTSQLGLTLTQVLLQISQGKRNADDIVISKGMFDELINQVLQPAINNSIQTLAGMLAQITASVAVDGLPGLNNILNSFGY